MIYLIKLNTILYLTHSFKRTSAGLIDDQFELWGSSNEQLELQHPDDKIYRAAETINMTLTKNISSTLNTVTPKHIIKELLLKPLMKNIVINNMT